jgi:hypothetical protein
LSAIGQNASPRPFSASGALAPLTHHSL